MMKRTQTSLESLFRVPTSGAEHCSTEKGDSPAANEHVQNRSDDGNVIPDDILPLYDIGRAREKPRENSEKIQFLQEIWRTSKDYDFPRRTSGKGSHTGFLISLFKLI